MSGQTRFCVPFCTRNREPKSLLSQAASDGSACRFFRARKKRKEGETISNKVLTKREQLFCLYYALLRSGRDAAARSGYSLRPERTAARLLERSEVQREIGRLSSAQATDRGEAAAGLRRLAFGSVTDAMKLLLSEDLPREEELAQMDFFNVAEIKRPKGGGLEIKFFDRLKPLEKLCQLSEAETAANGALPFYDALNKSAKALIGSDADE